MAADIAAASLASGIQAADSSQNESQERISELVKLEQDVRKMKSDCEDGVKKSGGSDSETSLKIKKYDELISKIEQEIRQIKMQDVKKSQAKKKTNSETNVSGVASRNDHAAISISALKASYRALSQPAVLQGDAAPAVQTDTAEQAAESTGVGETMDLLV